MAGLGTVVIIMSFERWSWRHLCFRPGSRSTPLEGGNLVRCKTRRQGPFRKRRGFKLYHIIIHFITLDYTILYYSLLYHIIAYYLPVLGLFGSLYFRAEAEAEVRVNIPSKRDPTSRKRRSTSCIEGQALQISAFCCSSFSKPLGTLQ